MQLFYVLMDVGAIGGHEMNTESTIHHLHANGLWPQSSKALYGGD